MTAPTFYWHDYETWGVDPRRDRPAQFAGVRTDAELDIIEEPLVLYCRPAEDLLPHPEACLVTGLTPLRVWDDGMPEAEFIGRINEELARPRTCGVGYNSIRFDDEITRHSLYRNLLDPYAREWQNGNSRWDLIDTVRLAHALRPEGIEWPKRDDGATSFRLEDLSAANGIEHRGAHEALADVYATIALARLLRERQRRLFDYGLTLRDKRRAAELLDLAHPRPVLHVSEKYPAAAGCIAPVWPIAPDPRNSNGILVFDLREDPELLLELDAEAIRERLFTPVSNLPEGVTRISLKTVRINHCPILAPMSTLTPEASERWHIDPAQLQRHAEKLAAAPKFAEKVRQVHEAKPETGETDPDFALYGGGFFSDADRREMARVQALPPADLATSRFTFQDPRLSELLFRFRARNWPETLSQEERLSWEAFRLRRLTDPAAGATITAAAYLDRLRTLRETYADEPDRLRILDELSEWGERTGIA